MCVPGLPPRRPCLTPAGACLAPSVASAATAALPWWVRSGPVDASEDFASSLFRFLAAVGEGTTEDERVALITNKLSSVVHCPLAGIALVDDTGAWTIRLEIRGEPVDITPALTEQLEPLYRLATSGPPLIVATREGGPPAPAVPPVLEALRVRRLAVVKLVSSRHELGVLFAGREAGRPFSPSERLALLAMAQQAAVGIENLRLNETLLRHSRSLERQNALILDAAGEGVYGLDTEGLTTFVNPAAARLLGWGVGDLLGQPMHAVLHHTHADGFAYPPEECPIYAAFKDGRLRFDAGRGGDPSIVETHAARVPHGIRTDAELQAAHDDNLRAALEQTGWKIYGPGGTAELLDMRPTTLMAHRRWVGLTKPVA